MNNKNNKYLVCNLKANKTKEEMINYEQELCSEYFNNSQIELIICPSASFLYLFQSEKYKLGSQDISKYSQGSYTGEITGEQLSSLNVKYALIGHSERRKLFKENNQTIIEKIKNSYHNNIKPIYFIGETEEQRRYGITKNVLEKEISNIIDLIPDYKREKIIIVYEPIWAIGSGMIPTKEEIEGIIITIKDVLNKKYQLNLPILYGGSVNEENIDILNKIEALDGFVLGEKSKKISELLKIYKNL